MDEHECEPGNHTQIIEGLHLRSYPTSQELPRIILSPLPPLPRPLATSHHLLSAFPRASFFSTSLPSSASYSSHFPLPFHVARSPFPCLAHLRSYSSHHPLLSTLPKATQSVFAGAPATEATCTCTRQLVCHRPAWTLYTTYSHLPQLATSWQLYLTRRV